MATPSQTHGGSVDRVTGAALELAHNPGLDVHSAIDSLISVAGQRSDVLDAAWQRVQHGLHDRFSRTGERAALLLRLAWVRCRQHSQHQ